MTTSTDPFEVIAAFVDGERVDPAELKAALATAEGRDYLADMAALREVIAEDLVPAAGVTRRPARRWLFAAAAAIVLSLGGYTLGHRAVSGNGTTASGASTSSSSSSSATAASPAPAPTRVIEVAPGSSYVPKGGQ